MTTSYKYKNGDKVTYKECFGEQVLTFVGKCNGLAYSNDAVVLYGSECVPVRLSGLSPMTSAKDEITAKVRELELLAYEYFKSCEVGPERTQAGMVYENIRTALKVGAL